MRSSDARDQRRGGCELIFQDNLLASNLDAEHCQGGPTRPEVAPVTS